MQLKCVFSSWMNFISVFVFSQWKISESSGLSNNSYHEETNYKSECSFTKYTDRRGIIKSPGYPQPYNNHTCMEYIISVKGPGKVITIRFDDVDIEESNELCFNPPCCKNNWFKVGPLPQIKYKHYCGQDRPRPDPLIIQANTLWIKFFTSSVLKGGRGFKLSYIVGAKNADYCQENEFQCNNKKCILERWHCNGFNECEDGSDEMSCAETCSFTEFRCHSGNKCISAENYCNGVEDCPDSSDEFDCNCGPNRTRCSTTSTQCYNVLTERCDGKFHCPKGEDEIGCSKDCVNSITCSSGIGCYTMNQHCDGNPHCGDFSDERNCDLSSCRSERGGFLCDNGRCIHETWKCDRVDDCEDGSDEKICIKNSVITAAIIGSLICGLLLVVAVSCTCKLFALRYMEHHPDYSRQTPLSRLEQEIMYREPPPSYAIAVGQDRPELSNLNLRGLHSQRIRRIRRLARTRRQAPRSVTDNTTLAESSSSLQRPVLSSPSLSPSGSMQSRSSYHSQTPEGASESDVSTATTSTFVQSSDCEGERAHMSENEPKENVHKSSSSSQQTVLLSSPDLIKVRQRAGIDSPGVACTEGTSSCKNKSQASDESIQIDLGKLSVHHSCESLNSAVNDCDASDTMPLVQ
ncbi:low-density lipoprotein receptor-related protein 12-like [Tachypleus tridentatus]|uniref:low-density lipoprotein receptor-related protein 12-like n=1 Tax=Tachypleus tridentatus TaxID=6853 RepID=UPI003FD1550C